MRKCKTKTLVCVWGGGGGSMDIFHNYKMKQKILLCNPLVVNQALENIGQWIMKYDTNI